MSYRVVRGGLLLQVALLLCGAWAGTAAAAPASGPREDIDQSFTTTRPATATGLEWKATYHAAGDPNGDPPFMKRMIFYPPSGMRLDTSVPDLCTASDAQLSVQGPDACPAGSRLGEGTVEGIFFVPFTDEVFDRYTHHVDVMNNTNEQVLLIESEGFTVQRGHIRPDGATEFNPTTCFPPPPGGQCADDYILQLGSSNFIPRYTRKSRSGGTRAYATTPPACPSSGYWESTVHFEWSDGSVDDVVSRQPCR